MDIHEQYCIYECLHSEYNKFLTMIGVRFAFRIGLTGAISIEPVIANELISIYCMHCLQSYLDLLHSV